MKPFLPHGANLYRRQPAAYTSPACSNLTWLPAGPYIAFGIAKPGLEPRRPRYQMPMSFHQAGPAVHQTSRFQSETRKPTRHQSAKLT